MPHIPITSHAAIRQLCQYMCLIWTQCSQMLDQKHWYLYILHYWNMPLTKYACHIGYICPTALLLLSTYRSHSYAQINQKLMKCNIYLPFYFKICNSINIPLKCHICQNHLMCINGGNIPLYIYMPHMSTHSLTMWPGALYRGTNGNDNSWLQWCHMMPQPN